MYIEHAVHINAPPARVWQVMVDVERWTEFAPQFKSIVRQEEGPLVLGSTARVTPHGFFGSIWTVTKFEPGRMFDWEATMLPGLHFVGGHVVELDGDGAKTTFSLNASGALATIFGVVLKRVFTRNTRGEAEAMKAYIERA